MKKIITLACILMTSSAFAASVKVTSFNYVTSTSRIPLAELCGVVEGVTAPAFVQVTIDPKASKPASYNTYAGVNGKFCLAVITYRGDAEVSLSSGEKTKISID